MFSYGSGSPEDQACYLVLKEEGSSYAGLLEKDLLSEPGKASERLQEEGLASGTGRTDEKEQKKSHNL